MTDISQHKPRCLARTDCPIELEGSQKFCYVHWAMVPRHIRNALFEAYMNNDTELIAKLTENAIASIAASKAAA